MPRAIAGAALAVVVLTVIVAPPGRAADWPSRPVTMVVPFAAGGPLDAIARVMAPPLGEHLGKPVIVENVAGGGGMTGSNRVAKAPGDGYQFVLATAGTHAYNQTLYKKPLYNAATDFAPVGIVAESFFVLLVRKDFPADTLADFIAYAQANEARMHFGSAGAGSATHIVCLLLNSAMGTKVSHVPYRSTMQAIEDVIAGRIDFVCDAGSTAVPLVEGNVVKAIAHLGPQRAPMLSNLATAREQGLPGIAVYGWNALFFPKETPEPIVRALNKAAGDMLERPALREQLHRIGLLIPSPERRSPNYLACFVVSEIETWAAPIKASGVSMD
jgi:tripartite-type tricarboxylate transporter receptor subunit TctC